MTETSKEANGVTSTHPIVKLVAVDDGVQTTLEALHQLHNLQILEYKLRQRQGIGIVLVVHVVVHLYQQGFTPTNQFTAILTLCSSPRPVILMEPSSTVLLQLALHWEVSHWSVYSFRQRVPLLY